ncbi:hypothetical protein TURU_128025 [Turdus rufiventris]|nr:hypothetical protein TURU_128025 [Turdus rufiventris]
MLHRYSAGLDSLKNADELFAKNFLDHSLLSLVDKKLSMTQTCALAAQKAKHTLGCIKSPVTRKLRERIVPLYSAMVTLYLECYIQLWDPKIRTWTCWSKYSGDYKAAQWTGAPLLWRQTERVWVGQPGEEEALRRP